MPLAGQGARQQQVAAQRRVEEAEHRLAAARAAEHAWSAGAVGEEQVAEALADLEQLGWVVLHDVAWPGRARANLDHVLVGPGGVLILDTGNWSGTVTVDATRGLRCNGYRKAKEVTAAETARQAVLPLIPTVPPTVVVGLICRAAHDQEPVQLDGGTVVVGRAQLVQHVLTRPTVLNAQTVMETSLSLKAALRRPADTTSTHSSRSGRSPRRTSPGTGKPTGRAKARPRKSGRGRSNAVKLGVLVLLCGAFLLYPEQVMQTYTSVVTAVITPITDQLMQNLTDQQATLTPTP